MLRVFMYFRCENRVPDGLKMYIDHIESLFDGLRLSRWSVVRDQQDILLGQEDILLGQEDILLGQEDILLGQEHILLGQEEPFLFFVLFE